MNDPTLWRRVRQGDREARETAIRSHMALIEYCRRRFPQMQQADDEDLRAAGIPGLVWAVDHYEPSRARFSTIACTAILREMHRWLEKTDRRGRPCYRKREMIAVAGKRCRNRGAEPTDEAMARELGLKDADSYRRFSAPALAFEIASGDSCFLGGDGGDPTDPLALSGLFASDQDVESAVVSRIEVERIRRAIGELPKKLREVAGMRWESGFTLQQCGERLGLSRQRIWQIELEARRAVRELLAD